MIVLNVKNMIMNQQHIFKVLKQNKIKDRLSHAYLFYGEDGVGKKEMAYALACLLYCQNDGCLECEDCKNILAGNHMNVDYIGIEESKKLISKEQIMDLQEEFSKTSLVLGTRIYIVDGIDTASASAQNSLLKFIEEPVNNTPTIGVFIAKDLANVVNTIVSRCALFHFPSLEQKALVKMLVSDGVDELDASLASCLTNNSIEAKEVILDEGYLKIKEFFINFLDIKKSKDAVLFYINNSNLLQNDLMRMFFKWLIVFYEDIFKAKDKDELIFTSLYDKINSYARVDYEKLKMQFEVILELYSKIDYNISAKNIFHELICKLF